MNRRLAAFAVALGLIVVVNACGEVNTDPGVVASLSLEPLPATAVVAGDSLRDTLGVARPLVGTAYDVKGQPLLTAAVRYRAADTGIVVDSTTGYVTGVNTRATGVRVVAEVGKLQTQQQPPATLFVVSSPDTVVKVNALDSLAYSLRDTSLNVSVPMTIRVMHRNGPALEPVQGWIASFALAPAPDPLLARLVGDNGTTPSLVDTTSSDGSAGRRIRISAARLTSLTDSVVVFATVKYRGAPILGSPARLVLRLKPQ